MGRSRPARRLAVACVALGAVASLGGCGGGSSALDHPRVGARCEPPSANEHLKNLVLVPIGIAFGKITPQRVRTRVTKIFRSLTNGSFNPFVGPLYDSSGKLQVPKGKKLSQDFLYSGWKWTLRGVVKG